MPIANLVYPSDIAGQCGCMNAVDTNGNSTEKVYVVMPPPPTKFPLYPYPSDYPDPCDTDIITSVKQTEVEKQIGKLAKKASTLRTLINNIEEKNKSVIVKASAYSYNLGEYKTADPEDPETMIEDENIHAILEILKAELEAIKTKIKDLSDQISVEP